MQEVPNWPGEQDATFPHARIMIDLGMGFRQYPLSALTVNREITTYLPDQVRTLEGISAAQGTAMLAPVEHEDTDLEGEILSGFVTFTHETEATFPEEFQVPAPAGLQEGDVVIAYQDQILGDWPPPVPQGGTEWFLVDSVTAANIRLAAFWKVAGPNEPAEYTFTCTEDFDQSHVSMAFVRGGSGEAPVSAVLPGPDDSSDAPETWFVDTPATETSGPSLELRGMQVILNDCSVPDAIQPSDDDTTVRTQQCGFSWHMAVASRLSIRAEDTGLRRFPAENFTHRRAGMTLNVPLADYPPKHRLSAATFPGHWSPFKDLVPVLSGHRFRVTAGLRSEAGDAMPSILVGRVVRENGSTSDPELDLELTDDAPLLQAPYRPQAVIADSLLEDDDDLLIFSPGLSATWIIADILALAGFHTLPAPDENTVFAATMLGSAQQNVGGNISQTGFPFGPSQLPYEASDFDQEAPAAFLDAAFAPLAASSLRARYFTTETVSIDVDPDSESLAVEFWVDFSSSSVSNLTWLIKASNRPGLAFQSPFELAVRVNALTSEVFASTVTDDRASMTISKTVVTPGPVRVYVTIESVAGFNYTARITICDSVDCSSDTESGSLGPEGTSFVVGEVEVQTDDALTGGIRVLRDPGDPEPVDFAPMTDLDPSLNELVATPQIGGDSGWETITDIASAELGAFWFSETGVPTFRNRASLAGIGQPVNEIVVPRRFSELRWEISTNQVYEAVVVPFAETGVDASGLVVWEARDQIRILGNGTRVFEVELDNPTIGVSVEFTANTQRNGEGSVATDDLVVEQLTQPDENRARFIIRNTVSGTRWLVDTDGRPDLQVVAFAAVTQDSFTDAVVEANPDAIGALQVSQNPWVQSSEAASNLAEFLAPQVSQPVPTIPVADGKPDARLQQGDILRLVDPVNTELRHRGLLVGYRNTQTPGTFEQSLTVRLLLDLWADFDQAWNPFQETGATLRDSENGTTQTNPLTITAPDNEDGDLLIAIVTARPDVEVSPPAGWELFREFQESNSTTVRTFVFTKTAASEPGSYDFTTPGDAHKLGYVYSVRDTNPELSPQIHEATQPGGWTTELSRMPRSFPVLQGDTLIYYTAGRNENIFSTSVSWTFDTAAGPIFLSPPKTSNVSDAAGLIATSLSRKIPRLELVDGATADVNPTSGTAPSDPSTNLVLWTNSVYLTWADFNDHWSGRTWDDFDADPASAPEDGG